MSSDLVVQEAPSFDVLLQETKSMQSFCRALMETPHYRKMGEEGVFAIVQMAQTLGINPRNALNGELYYTQGRVGMYAEAMSKYIRMKGHSISVKELTATKCVLVGTRADNKDTATITYTLADAQKAGLVKTNSPWEKHPMQMLWSRCISILKKVMFADLLTNIMTKEEMVEMGEIKDDGAINAEVEVIQEIKRPSNEQIDYLKALMSQCAAKYADNANEWVKNVHGSFENLPIEAYELLKAKTERKVAEQIKEKTIEIDKENEDESM